jgi:hypothetical protein
MITPATTEEHVVAGLAIEVVCKCGAVDGVVAAVAPALESRAGESEDFDVVGERVADAGPDFVIEAFAGVFDH